MTSILGTVRKMSWLGKAGFLGAFLYGIFVGYMFLFSITLLAPAWEFVAVAIALQLAIALPFFVVGAVIYWLFKGRIARKEPPTRATPEQSAIGLAWGLGFVFGGILMLYQHSYLLIGWFS